MFSSSQLLGCFAGIISPYNSTAPCKQDRIELLSLTPNRTLKPMRRLDCFDSLSSYFIITGTCVPAMRVCSGPQLALALLSLAVRGCDFSCRKA